MYSFFLYDFCDIYLEATKVAIASRVAQPLRQQFLLRPQQHSFTPNPVIQGVFFSSGDAPSPASAAASARACLWLCLDQYTPQPNVLHTLPATHHVFFAIAYNDERRSLKLMHPLMPFVTEELWNRLPHLSGEAPSLMIATYGLDLPAFCAPLLGINRAFLSGIQLRTPSAQTLRRKRLCST
jgi:hypothetical protein